MTQRFVHRHLPYLLARASHVLWRGFEPQVRAAGLSSLEWRVLATLSDAPPLSVGHLAAEVLAQQPTLTKLLDRMAAQGWVERSSDPDDARRSRVALSAAGQAKVAPLLAAADDYQAGQLQALGVGSLEGLPEALNLILQKALHGRRQDGG